MFMPRLHGGGDAVLPNEKQTRYLNALEAIKSAVAADQDPSPSNYVLHYQQRTAGLHNELATAQIEAETNEREQDAAVACLMGLEISQ